MKAISGFFKEIGAREAKLSLYAWLVSALAGAAILWGFHELFVSVSGNPLSDRGLYYYWLPTFFNDLSINYPGSSAALAMAGLAIFIVLWLLSLFLSGGVYALLLHQGRVSIKRLITLSAGHFTRMLKLFFANIPNFIAASLIPGILFYIYYKKQSSAIDETIMMLFIYGWGALLVLFFIYSIAVYDLSRIHALREERGIFKSLKSGIRSVFSNKLYFLIIFIVYLVLVALLSFLCLRITGLFNDSRPEIIVIAIQQVFLFLRYFSKILLMRAETRITIE